MNWKGKQMLKIHHSTAVLMGFAEDHANKLMPLLKMRLRNKDNIFLSAYFTSDALLKEILTATPKKLLSLNEDIYTTMLATHLQADIDSAAGRLCNYDEFKKRNPLKYRGDNLLQTLDLNTCPYCNLRDIRITLDEHKLVEAKPALDHFFPESRFPFLALSFFNLIPSCTFCNSNFKIGKEMRLRKNTHPYISGFEDKCVIDLKDYKDIDDILGKKEGKFNLYFNNIEKKRNFDGNITLFKLTNQYSGYRDAARRTLRKAVNYSPAVVDSLLKISNANRHTAFETAFDTKFRFSELHQNPLSKLNRDIVRKYGNAYLKAVLNIT
jgi:hypothetical protein